MAKEENQPELQLETSGGTKPPIRTAIGAANEGRHLRAVVCQPNPLVRAGLKTYLESTCGIQVIADVHDGTAAWLTAEQSHPELLITDIEIDGLSGLEVCTNVRSACPDCKILIYTDCYSATRYYNRLCRAGATSIILKGSPLSVLDNAVNQAFTERPAWDPNLEELIDPLDVSLKPLTQAQFEIFRRISLSKQEIAEELGISEEEVREELKRILKSLQVPNEVRALLKAADMRFTLLPVQSHRGESGKTDEEIAAETSAQRVLDGISD